MEDSTLDRRQLYSCVECRTPKYVNELIKIDGEYVCRNCLSKNEERMKS